MSFSEVAELLGVRLDLTDVELSRVRVSNKPDKAAEVAGSKGSAFFIRLDTVH